MHDDIYMRPIRCSKSITHEFSPVSLGDVVSKWIEVKGTNPIWNEVLMEAPEYTGKSESETYPCFPPSYIYTLALLASSLN